jgi:hypothetical protein
MSERDRILGGCVLLLLGAGLSLTVSADVGSGFMLVGVVIAVHGLHRFGRTGADRFEPPKAA